MTDEKLFDYNFLDLLSRELGEAFYIADRRIFADNGREFLREFQKIYDRCCPGYSYKTNYLPAFALEAERLGYYAEVVSGLELKLALKLKIRPERIIFNGPWKTAKELHSALNLGVQVNIDSDDEFELISRIRKAEPKEQFNLGIRCNIKLKNFSNSRFGIESYGSTLIKMTETIKKWPATRLKGLHAHICPPGKRPEDFRELTEKLIVLSDKLFPEKPPEQLNLGGGFFSRMPEELKKRWPQGVPGFVDYANAIAGPMAEHFQRHPERPELILEPGLALAADSMFFVCRVAAKKHLGKKIVVTATGSSQNIKPSGNNANLPLKVVRAPGNEKLMTNLTGSTDIAGYTCIEDDFLYRDCREELNCGDFLIFANVGAYTIVLQPPFIRKAPAIISLDENEGKNGFTILRRPQSDAEFWQTYRIPGISNKIKEEQ